MTHEAEWLSTDQSYRAISPWAVSSLVLGAVSISGFLVPNLTWLAIPGVASAIMTFRSCARYEMRGRRLAIAGVWLSAFFAIVIPMWHIVSFRSEAPANVLRLNFATFDADAPTKADLAAYQGQRVCLKGYAYPVYQPEGITSFAMTHNGKFGQDANSVGVLLAPSHVWSYSFNAQAVSGTLIENPNYEEDQPGSPKWLLKDSEVRPSRCPVQLSFRVRGQGC